jgi:hypothetical protein
MGGLAWLLGDGCDWHIYREAALRFLGGGSYFLPGQMTPHPLAWGDVLYPPTCLWLFAPFALMPALAWHLTPVAMIVAAIWRLRPSAWAWVAMAWLAVWPVTVCYFMAGNPLTWAVAWLFMVMAWDLPASMLLAFPSLLPFAFIGWRRRRWWIGLAVLAVLSLPLLALNLTWVRVLLGTSGTGGVLYGIRDWPVMCLPLVATARGYAPARNAWRRLAVTVAPRSLDTQPIVRPAAP